MCKSYFLTFSSFPPLLGALMCLFEMDAKSPLSLSLSFWMYFYSWRQGFSKSKHPPSSWSCLWEGHMDAVLLCLLSSCPAGLVPTHLEAAPRQSQLLPDKSRYEPSWPPAWGSWTQARGQEDLGLDPEGSWGMGSRASYLTSLDLSLHLYNMTHPAGMESAYESLEHWKSSVKTGVTPSHFRGIIAEGLRAYGASWQNTQGNWFYHRTRLPELWGQCAHVWVNKWVNETFISGEEAFKRDECKLKTRWKLGVG